jgi:hypothetical protein
MSVDLSRKVFLGAKVVQMSFWNVKGLLMNWVRMAEVKV